MGRTKNILGAGVFCEVYGDNPRNRVLEHFLALRESDIAVSELLDLLGLSKPTVYATFEELLNSKIILKSRIIGKTQLYKLNMKSKKVKLLIKSFDECLKYAINKEDEEKEINSHSSTSSSRTFALSAKHCWNWMLVLNRFLWQQRYQSFPQLNLYLSAHHLVLINSYFL